MRTSTKIIIPIALLFLAGCAHHGGLYSGYYSGYSDSAAYAVGVGNFAPYPAYYDRPVVVHNHQRRPFYRHNHRPYYKNRPKYRGKHYANPRDSYRGHPRRDFYAGRENRGRYFPDRQHPSNRSGNRNGERRWQGRRNDREGRRRGNDFSRNR
jgi:hypothetical protein